MSRSNRARTERALEQTSNGELVARESVTFETRAYPSAEELAAFEQVLPGAADRILNTYEGQVLHRQYPERTHLNQGVLARYAGLAAGLIVALAGFVLTFQLAALGQPVLAGVVASLDLLGLVYVFVTGQQVQKAERIEKNNQSQVQPSERRR